MVSRIWLSCAKTVQTRLTDSSSYRYLSINMKGKKYENLIWYYQYPTHESAALEGLVSFYNKDGVDILVDGLKI